MVMIFGSVSQYPSERRDNEQFSGFQGSGDNSPPQFGQVVFIGSSDLFDKAVHMKPFEHARYLIGSFAGNVFSDSAVAQAADVEFAPCNSLEQFQIVAVKKVEAAIAAAIVADGARNLFDVFLGRAGVVDGGDEIDIASVCGTRQFGKHIQAVDAFLQRRKFHFACAVAMFHPAVVFEKGNVVDCCFDAQHQAVLIIHFDRHRPHVMLNACSLYTGVEIVAQFILIIAVKFSSQKCGDVVGLDGMYGRPDQFVIDGRKIALSFENNVGGIFGLHDAPVIAVLKKIDDRTVQAGISVEYLVNTLDDKVVGQALSPVKVFDVDKTIVEHGRLDAFLGQLRSQFVMAVEIELETKRRPRRHSQITQAKLGVDGIEVVMQTFAAVILEKRFVGIFVMPGLITGAWLHCREDVYKAGTRSPLSNNLLYALFFAKILFADEVNGKAVLGGNSLCVLPDLIPQRHRPLGIVENTDVLLLQKQRHSLGVTDTGNGAGQNNTVKAGSDTFDFITISFNEIRHVQPFQYIIVPGNYLKNTELHKQ